MTHVQSVQSAVRIMELLAQEEFLGVSDIARALSLPKASVFRIINTLAESGWLEENYPDSRQWGVTTAFTSSFARTSVSFSDAAQQAVTAGRDETGETTYVVVPSGGALMVVYRAESNQSLKTSLPIATRIPFDVSTTGAVYLSRLPEAERLRILTDPATMLQNPRIHEDQDLLDRLNERLTAAGSNGFAVAHGLWRTDIGGVAAPIVDGTGRPVGAVGLSFPLSRLPSFSTDKTGAVLKRLAGEIARSL